MTYQYTTFHLIHAIVLLVIAFALPLFPNAIAGLFVVLLLNALSYFFIQKPGINPAYKAISIASFVYYGIQILGLINTENLSNGLFELEIKLLFGLAPIALLLGPTISDKNKHAVVQGFIGALLISFAIGWHNCYQAYLDIPAFTHIFISPRFSPIIHLGYLAMYINFAYGYLLYNWFKERFIFSKAVHAILIIVFVLAAISTSSRNGLVILVLLSLGIPVYNYVQKGNIKQISILIALFILGGTGIMTLYPDLLYRFKAIFDGYKELNSNDISTYSAVSVRLQIWYSCFVLIKQHFLLGVGTGDVTDQLVLVYHNLQLEELENTPLTPHNQYIENLLTNGIASLLALLVYLWLLVKKGIKQNRPLLTLLVFIVSIAGLTESILEVQAGISFFIFVLILNNSQPDLEEAPVGTLRTNISLTT